MKKTCRFVRLILPALLLACIPGIANAAPYGPDGRVINWVQPNGEKLTLRVFGDEYFARTVTSAGYTVVYNRKDGYYHYAADPGKGKTLSPSGTRAHLPAPAGLAKGTALSRERALEIITANRKKLDGDRYLRWSRRVEAARNQHAGGIDPSGSRSAPGPNAAPVIGSYRGLTICAQFPNDPSTPGSDPIKFPTTRNKIVSYCNDVGYNEDGNTGSVRDYFADQSLGKMEYTQKVTPIITLPNPRNYYNFQDYPTNSIFRDDAGRVLLLDAINVLKGQGFDFSGLSTDTDGNVLATSIFFAGPDSGVWAQGLWPHQWSLAAPVSVGTSGSPAFISAYQITNIENSAPVIGTFVHENGHLILDYPDLYSYINDGEGVGDHCVMGGGSYLNDGKTPAPLNAYFKDVVGWGNVTDLLNTTYTSRTLQSTGNIAYRIRKPGTPTEYFIVENRGAGDKWAAFAEDKGILIWHIDETIDGNGNRLDEDPHYGVSLEQADGRNDLERGANRGDTTDAYDLLSPLFSDTSNPNATWWDGSISKARVKVLGNPASKVDVQFGLLPPDSLILDSPNGGEVLYRNSKFQITWEANIIGGVKIDLYKGGVFNMNIANNLSSTSGRYSWNVPLGFKPGKDYTVRISSISNPKPVFDASDANFTITDSTFPEDNAIPYGWFKPSDADAGWQFTKSQIYEGTGSLVSKPISDGETAAIAYRSKFKAGNISFYIKVSSEVGYDHAAFYIDGVKQLLPTASNRKGISGFQTWTFASFPLTAGKHTLMWAYEKDDSYESGKDLAWLDGVLLPETTQEIVVENDKGQTLTSNSSTVVFPDVEIATASEPRTITIKNVGKSDLHGLKVALKGADPDSFSVDGLGKTALKPGKSTTFQITFNPAAPGEKQAKVQILSNDENESPFNIEVVGNALGIPEIIVRQPSDNKLKDGGSTVQFGKERVGQTGQTKTFSVKNVGSASLSGLEVNKAGAAKGDFEVYAIGSTKLAPGESTTFKVTFNPKKPDLREAELRISYKGKTGGPFEVTVKGTGQPKKAASNSAADLVAAVLGGNTEQSSVVTSSSMIGGLKYLTLTYSKSVGVERSVEVSPNLVDWFSGNSHTSIVTDNESHRTVRDNTPVTPGTKRYIRLKETQP